MALRPSRWIVALLLIGSAASAQRVRVAVHPLSAPGVEDLELVKELDAQTRDILAETERITAVNDDDVAAALAAESGRCPARADARLACLERLALATRAEYSLAVELKKFGKTYEFSAVIAAANRAALLQPEAIAVAPDGNAEALFKAQLRRLLLDQLKLATLPAIPEKQTVAPVVVSRPEVVPVSAPAVVRSGHQRLAGQVLVLGGVAVAIGGAVALGMSAADVGQLQPDSRRYLPPEQVGLYQQAKTRQLVGALLVGGGAALAAVGAIVWSSSPNDLEVTVAPTASGLTAVLGGSF